MDSTGTLDCTTGKCKMKHHNNDIVEPYGSEGFSNDIEPLDSLPQQAIDMEKEMDPGFEHDGHGNQYFNRPNGALKLNTALSLGTVCIALAIF